MNEEEQRQTHGRCPSIECSWSETAASDVCGGRISHGGDSLVRGDLWCERKGDLDVDGDLTALGTDAGINDTNPGLNLVMEYSCPFQSAGESRLEGGE
jgi:hypothetical protein